VLRPRIDRRRPREPEPEDPWVDPLNDDAQIEIPAELPLLPLRDIVVFPYMIIPLFVGGRSIDASTGRRQNNCLLVAQRDVQVEEPRPRTSRVGTVAWSCAC
jgi:ATP-dependent Lon protease